MSVQGTTFRVLPGGSPDPNYGEGSYTKGSSDDASLKASFPANPISAASITSIQETFQNVLDGNQSSNADFGTINMDYNQAPNLRADIAIHDEGGLHSGVTGEAGDGRGMSAGPFVPTTATPGEGSTDPDNQPPVIPVGSSGDGTGTASPQDHRYSYKIGEATMGESTGMVPGETV